MLTSLKYRGRITTSCILVGVLVVAALSSSPAWARKRGQPMPIEDVTTTWVGVSEDEQFVVRFVLKEDQTGLGAYTFLDQEARPFVISSWHYKEGEISIEPIPPADAPSWVRPMEGRVVGVTLHLRAADDDWEVKIRLRREAELEDRWTRLKHSMNDASPISQEDQE